MQASEIARERLYHQSLSPQRFTQPAETVAWLGAVQAQDYLGAKWAVGQRTQGANEAAVEAAYNAGKILRTHVLRPTWHFLAAEDIRWVLALSAPRVHKLNALYYRKFELDAPTLQQTTDLIVNALRGGKQLTRKALGAMLAEAGIVTDTLRLSYIMMYAELEAVICSGAMQGKQFTYALIDERAAAARPLARDEAFAELVRRYFQSHGPAQVKDFVWWSGLTVAETNAVLAGMKPEIDREVIEGKTYWFYGDAPVTPTNETACYLLPNFDEALASYEDRSASTAPEQMYLWKYETVILPHLLVFDGKLLGTWQRTVKKKSVVVEARPFGELRPEHQRALAAAAERYRAFLGVETVEIVRS